jgi:uncharacterized membrane protein
MSRPKKSKAPQSKTAAKAAPKAAPAAVAATAGQPKVSTYLYAAAALLALVGFADSIYLTANKLAGVIPQCSTGGCEEVLNGPYSTVGPVPISALGMLAYFTAFTLATLTAFGNRKAADLMFYVVAIMLAVSIYLFILQAFVIKHFCLYCLLSASITVLLAVIVAADHFYFRRRQ